MKIAYCARALTKTTFSLGAPLGMVAPCFIIPLLLGLLAGLWELLIPSVIIYIYIRWRYRKDEYWFSNLLDSLREEQDLEP